MRMPTALPHLEAPLAPGAGRGAGWWPVQRSVTSACRSRWSQQDDDLSDPLPQPSHRIIDSLISSP